MKTINTKIGTGETRLYTVDFSPFGFLEQEHIYVYDGDDDDPLATAIPFTWFNQYQIELSYPVGEYFKIRRIVPKDILQVDYKGGAALTPHNLNDSQIGLYQIIEEMEDGVYSNFVVPATEEQAGVAEIATQTETNNFTDDRRIVTPKKLGAIIQALPFPDTATTFREGIIELATQTEVDEGVDSQRAVTPSKLQGKLDTEVFPYLGNETYGMQVGDITLMHPDVAALDNTLIFPMIGQEINEGDYTLGTLNGYLTTGNLTGNINFNSTLHNHTGFTTILTPNFAMTGTSIYKLPDTGMTLESPTLTGDPMIVPPTMAMDKLLLSEAGVDRPYMYDYDLNTLTELDPFGVVKNFGEIIFGHLNDNLNLYVVLHIEGGVPKLETSPNGITWVLRASLPELGIDLVKAEDGQEIGAKGSLNYSNGKYYVVSNDNFELYSIDETNLSAAAVTELVLNSATPFYYTPPIFDGLIGMFQEHTDYLGTGLTTVKYTTDGGMNWQTGTFTMPNYDNAAPNSYHILDNAVMINYTRASTARIYVSYNFFTASPLIQEVHIYNDSIDLGLGGFIVSETTPTNIFYVGIRTDGAFNHTWQDLYTRDISSGGKLKIPDMSAFDDIQSPQRFINVLKGK